MCPKPILLPEDRLQKQPASTFWPNITCSQVEFDKAIAVTTEIIDGGVHKLNTQRFGSDKNVAIKDVVWDMFRVENKSLAGNTEGLLMTIDRYGMDGNTEGDKIHEKFRTGISDRPG